MRWIKVPLSQQESISFEGRQNLFDRSVDVFVLQPAYVPSVAFCVSNHLVHQSTYWLCRTFKVLNVPFNSIGCNLGRTLSPGDRIKIPTSKPRRDALVLAAKPRTSEKMRVLLQLT
jgi:hypothetical protein